MAWDSEVVLSPPHRKAPNRYRQATKTTSTMNETEFYERLHRRIFAIISWRICNPQSRTKERQRTKLNVSFWEYMDDRIKMSLQILLLADLITPQLIVIDSS